MRRFISVVIAWLLAGLFLGPLAPAAAQPCDTDWGTEREEAAGGFGGSVTNVRTGTQDCFDRLVVDVSGAAGGYAVEYVGEVRDLATNAVVPLRGGATLRVLARAAAVDGAGNPTYTPADPAELADVAAYPAFRQVAWAGTAGGESAIGVGVRERLPFRVFTLAGPGAGSRLVVDVAHNAPGDLLPPGDPFGNYESARGVTGGIEVKGWTIDPDTTAPIYVWVTVDGAGRHLLANRTRNDVAAVYPAYGPSHGFLGTVPASPGAHTVCVTASNVGAGDHAPLGCRTVTVPGDGLLPPGDPFGNYESARGVTGGIEVKGWTIDPDTTAPIYVWVTVDGAGRHLLANRTRNDVAAVYPAYGPGHGFLGTVPASPGAHTVCVTASNVGAGNHRALGCRSVTTLTGPPVGNFESATGIPGGIDVKGWTIDPDTTAPVYVWATMGGVGRYLVANRTRDDVGAAYPGYGPRHGFRNTLTTPPGSRTVCLTASNVGPGSNTSLGCRTVTVPALPSALLGSDWERIPTTAKVVALTFDGGASDGAVSSILATLTAKDVPATFFLTGNFARTYPARVAAMAANGHRLGNHSDTHASYPSLTNEQIAADLARAEGAIARAAGPFASPSPLFRFPFGDRTPADIVAVNDAGYVPVRWTVDTLGWQGTSGGITEAIVRQRVLDTLQPGQIVLMHVGAHPTDGSRLDADALPGIIDELRARGYSFVTLDALLR